MAAGEPTTQVAPSDTQQRTPQHPQKMPEGMMPNLLQTTPGQDQPHRPTTPGPLSSPTGKITPACQRLLRKEVIQPHLPVRLPCYDFVPIAGPTFTHSLPQTGVGPQVSGVTNFHDVTGGVYKARERIHRGVADPRLLATPPSWGRVADPNPN